MTTTNQKSTSTAACRHSSQQRRLLFTTLLLLSLCSLRPNHQSVHAWMISSPLTTAKAFTTSRRMNTLATTQLFSSSNSNDQQNLSDPNHNNSNNNDPVALARMRLEMHWNLQEAQETQECIVEDPSTCNADECPDCHGEGEIICRFCRGTAQMYVGSMVNRHSSAADKFNNNPLLQRTTAGSSSSSSSSSATSDIGGEGSSFFQRCPICHEGHEVCTSCRGTGWIADWTKPTSTPDEDDSNNSNNNLMP